MLQLAGRIVRLPRPLQGVKADIRPGDAEKIFPFLPAQRLRGAHRQRVGFLAAGAADAPQGPGPRHAFAAQALAQVALEQLERRGMTEKTGFLDGQAVQQGRPLHCATRTVGHLAVVAVVVADAQFTHARGQAGLQERPALLVEHHAGAVLQQDLPVAELRCRHIGQRLQ